MAAALDIIEVVAEMAILGQRVLNVMHAVSTNAVSDSDLADDLRDHTDGLFQTVVGNMSGALSFESIILKNITAGTDIGAFTWPTLTLGDIAGAEYLPLGVAGLVTFPTEILGVRGRKFIPGMVEAQNSSAVWGGTLMAALVAFGEFFITPWVGAASAEPWSYVIFRPGAPTAPQLPVSYLVSNVPAYQRRRKQGVGE